MHKDYDKLLNYSFRLLSKKRYTTAEIEKKLKFYSKRRSIKEKENIPKVLERLCELKYLNDEDYARDFVKSRTMFKPRGKILIRRELLMKGLKNELVNKIINSEEIDEESMGQILIDKKSNKWSALNPKERREKSFQLLARKGISIDSIYKILDKHYNLPSEVES